MRRQTVRTWVHLPHVAAPGREHLAPRFAWYYALRGLAIIALPFAFGSTAALAPHRAPVVAPVVIPQI